MKTSNSDTAKQARIPRRTWWAEGRPTDGRSAGGVDRKVFLLLASVALVYALLAGLRTVADYDTGWQLATGRWVVQHHQIPSVDVFSFTAQGKPWIYPVGAGVLLYAVFRLGGYALLSWVGAVACAGSIALLLRRGNATTAALAILAVPLIAYRTAPRADMFTVVLFAAFLSLLWEHYKTGCAPLWCLPLLMLLWVNVHFGFAAGAALVLAYAGLEGSEMVLGEVRRRAALQRLRHASGWLLCTLAVTLVNPWGWGIYRALLRQEQAAGLQETSIGEWTGLSLSWNSVQSALGFRDTINSAIYLLLLVAIVAAILALARRQLGAATLLLAGCYPAIRHIRMGAILACMVVVIGGSVLGDEVLHLGSRLKAPRTRLMAGYAAVAFFASIAMLRSFDLVSNRHYFGGDTDNSTFGPGLSWWFPKRAADFIEREKLPGEILNTYDMGGFLTWQLYPHRRDYIDGRDTLFGTAQITRHLHLLQSPPDSAAWQEEADRYAINTVIVSVARYDGLQFVRLKDFCASHNWRPVYLDEVAAVFVRRSPENEGLIQRLEMDCATARLPIGPASNRADAFNQWANAAAVFAALDRSYDALTASAKANAIFPGSAIIHLVRANALFVLSRKSEAEEEYRQAVALHPDQFTWSALADFYRKVGRDDEAVAALKKAIQFQPRPEQSLVQLGYYSLHLGRANDALAAFDKAVRSAAPQLAKETGRGSFPYNVATGRAQAWEILGDIDRALAYQQEAVRLAPDAPQAWLNLAHLYHLDGREADASVAKARAAEQQGH